jgi:hypothetical protein
VTKRAILSLVALLAAAAPPGASVDYLGGTVADIPHKSGRLLLTQPD